MICTAYSVPVDGFTAHKYSECAIVIASLELSWARMVTKEDETNIDGLSIRNMRANGMVAREYIFN